MLAARHNRRAGAFLVDIMRERKGTSGNPPSAANCSFCLGVTAGTGAAAAATVGGAFTLAAAVAGLAFSTGYIVAAGPWRRGLGGFGVGLFAATPLVAALVGAVGHGVPNCGPIAQPLATTAVLVGLGLAIAGAVPIKTSPDASADRMVRGGIVAGMIALAVTTAALMAQPCQAAVMPAVDDVTGSVGAPLLRRTLP